MGSQAAYTLATLCSALHELIIEGGDDPALTKATLQNLYDVLKHDGVARTISYLQQKTGVQLYSHDELYMPRCPGTGKTHLTALPLPELPPLKSALLPVSHKQVTVPSRDIVLWEPLEAPTPFQLLRSEERATPSRILQRHSEVHTHVLRSEERRTPSQILQLHVEEQTMPTEARTPSQILAQSFGLVAALPERLVVPPQLLAGLATPSQILSGVSLDLDTVPTASQTFDLVGCMGTKLTTGIRIVPHTKRV